MKSLQSPQYSQISLTRYSFDNFPLPLNLTDEHKYSSACQLVIGLLIYHWLNNNTTDDDVLAATPLELLRPLYLSYPYPDDET